jgi:hypothetical protein
VEGRLKREALKEATGQCRVSPSSVPVKGRPMADTTCMSRAGMNLACAPYRLWWLLAALLLACACAFPAQPLRVEPPVPVLELEVPAEELSVPVDPMTLPPWLALPMPHGGAKPPPLDKMGLPPSHRAVQLWTPPYNGPRVTGDGQTMRLSAGVGHEPLRLAVWWHVTIRSQDRELSLIAIDEEAETPVSRSESTISHQYPTETRTAHWELPAGRYEVVACVRPGRRCLRAAVVVQGVPVV